MGEAVSSLGYGDFVTRVSRYMGFPTVAADRSAQETGIVDEVIQDGVKRFYRDNATGWRFMKPTESIIIWADVAVVSTVTVSGGAFTTRTTITATAASFHPLMVGKNLVITGVGTFPVASYTSTTVIVVTGDASTASADTFSVSGAGDYTLDANWASLEMDLTFDTDDYLHEIRKTSESNIRRMRQSGITTGIPQLYAERIREGDGATDHRIEVLLWPIPDKDYTVSAKFNIHPPLLSTAFPYPLGGPLHNDTVLRAIMAQAESDRDDIEDGPKESRYVKALTASLFADARQGAPEFVGKNNDTSDGVSAVGISHTVTVNGITP